MLIWGRDRKPKAPPGLGESRDRPCRFCGLVRTRWDNDSDKDCPTYRRGLRRKVLILGICVVALVLGMAGWFWFMQRTGSKGPIVEPGEKLEQGVKA